MIEKPAMIFLFILTFTTSLFAAPKCSPIEYAVKKHHRREYVRSDGVSVKATDVREHCRPRSKGYDFLYSRFKEGIPRDWPHRAEKPANWSEEEKARMLEALEIIPEILWAEKIVGLYRMKKSKDDLNPATSGENGTIVIYDSAFTSLKGLERILAHEFAHHNFYSLTENERLDYRLATGWKPQLGLDRNIYWSSRPSGFIEEDGKTSSEEDYANNLEHFLVNSDKLKEVTPKAYAWMLKKFGEKFKLRSSKK